MPVKKRCLILILFLSLIFPATAAAYDSTAKPTAGFFFVEEITSASVAQNTVNLLVFCDTTLTEDTAGYFIALGGSIEVRGSIEGAILTLFTKTVSTGAVKYGIINLKLLFLPFNLIAGLALIAVYRDFIEQSAAYFEKNKKSVFKFGVYGYLMALLLIGIFFISVSGAAVALAGLLALAVITAAGHVPASVTLGYNILKGRVKGYNIYTLFITGSVIIDIIKLLPYAGDLLLLTVAPMLSLGIFAVLVIHKYFYRAYVRMSFDKCAKAFDRHKINSVILGSSVEKRTGGVQSEREE